jgi:lipoate-protein ligase A
MTGGRWRLVDTGPLDGPADMAIDEALLEAFDSACSPPVFRLYGWNPPALSLGRFQDPAATLDLERCREEGIPVVRRITGGGVIYHGEELTYSIVCAQRHLPPSLTIKESYRHLTGFLLDFYRDLGLAATWAVDGAGNAPKPGRRTPFCFAGREDFDVLVGGGKIGGNAQRRLRGAIFQHGSIPLQDRVATGLRYLRELPAPDDLRTTSLGELGVNVPSRQLVRRLAAAFETSLGISLRPSELTTEERECAATLAAGKYSEFDWDHGRSAS